MTDHTAGQSVANHDAVPAAIASVESVVPQPTTRGDSDRTDKAAPRPSEGTGDTSDDTSDRLQPIKEGDSDRSKPIRDARLAALEQLSALDQKLELEYGIVGNPMIKAQPLTAAKTNATLTDAERKAMTLFSDLAWTALRWSEVERHAATLRGLLERLK